MLDSRIPIQPLYAGCEAASILRQTTEL